MIHFSSKNFKMETIQMKCVSILQKYLFKNLIINIKWKA